MKVVFKISTPDSLLGTAIIPTEGTESTIRLTSQDWPVPRDLELRSVLQALLNALHQAAPGFPDADLDLSIRLAILSLGKVRHLGGPAILT